MKRKCGRASIYISMDRSCQPPDRLSVIIPQNVYELLFTKRRLVVTRVSKRSYAFWLCNSEIRAASHGCAAR